MPDLLVYLASVERLAANSEALPPGIVRALEEDVEYARFGAALLSLPELWVPERLAHFGPLKAKVFQARGRVAMGLKMAELVGTGGLVGREPGLAFVAGYFTHLCLERGLAPLERTLAERFREAGQSQRQVIEKHARAQAYFFLRELYGSPLLGTPRIRPKLQILKRHGPPMRGVGRGLYELVRLSAQEGMGLRLAKSNLDRWAARLYLYGLFLSVSPGHWQPSEGTGAAGFKELYRGPALDYWEEIEKCLTRSRQVLTKLFSLIERGRFTARSTARFLEEFPEAPAGTEP